MWSLNLKISGYVPIAKISATNVNSSSLSGSEYKKISKQYFSRDAVNFLSNYNNDDTSVVKLNGNSTPVWGVSPSSQLALINDLNPELNNKSMTMKITWYVSRHKLSKTQNMDLTVYKGYDIDLSNKTRNELIVVINDTSTNYNSTVTIENIFPNFLRVPEKESLERFQLFRSLNLRIEVSI